MRSRATTSTIAIPAPEGCDYLPYQRAGIDYASRRNNCLIADEMGLGKTIQAIGVANLDPKAVRILVVTPASLKRNWIKEIQKWDVKHLTVGEASGTKTRFPDYQIVVINYEILKAHRAAIRACEWDLVVCDEAHYLKRGKSDRTLEVFGGIKRNSDKTIKERITKIPARRLVLMTGTPILNKPSELWPLIHALDPYGLGSDWKYYAERYCQAEPILDGAGKRIGWWWAGADNLEELQGILRERFMVRRLKKDVLKELPPKRRQIIPLAADKKLAKLLKQEAVEFDEYVAEHGEPPAFEGFSKAMKEVGLAMVEPMLEEIDNHLEQMDKLVVFCYHKEVAARLYENYAGRAVVITGDVAVDDRQGLADRFQDDPSIKLFIGTIGAAGTGFTLTAASTMLVPERCWVPGIVSQAEDRLHRIGQKESVLIKHYVLAGSLAEREIGALISKQEIADKALD